MSWPVSRKLTIVFGAVLGLALIITAVLLIGSSRHGVGQDDASLYTKRAGYDQARESIGDPLALVSKPTNTVVQYAGVPVVQPCSLLTLKDIRATGLKIRASQLTGAVQRVFFDGQGAAALPAASDFSLPLNDDSNFCQYRLENNGNIELTVYQPSYASDQAVARQVNRSFSPAGIVEGLQAFSEQPGKSGENTSIYMLRGSGISLQLRITASDTAAKTKLLHTVARHAAAAGSTPTPLAQFEYDSPIFSGATVSPCGLVDNADFRGVLGVDSSPLAQETLGSAVGVIQDQKGGKRYNFVSHDCKRRSADGSTRDKTLTIKTLTYETVEGAQAATAFEKSGSSLAQGVEPVKPNIGDESYFADAAGLENALVIRKGRALVYLSFYLPQGNDSITSAQRIEALSPLAQKITDRSLQAY